MYIEILIIAVILVFIYIYRKNTGDSSYKFINKTIGDTYNKYAPYSFKVVREKAKELGQEYTSRQYAVQIIIFGVSAAFVAYLYFYSILWSVVYAVAAILMVPYLAYMRCKKAYSEFIFEQIQVYTTNVIMEFNTTQSFVKALEGVRDSGVLEDPLLTDVKEMIQMSYENGTIDEAIRFMNEKYDYYVIKNMHQLFLQITKEGSKDSGEALEGMLQDIDMLVESVYRDRIDRTNFYKKFIMFGLMLYLLVLLIQLFLGESSYVALLDEVFVVILLHCVILINTYFLISGIKYYHEDVGAE
ncbi:putative uncharacterized protein [Clostridium sp. CAG:1000]|jgi:hypothetical protein|nr:hypothetical protein [Clostridium sp.]CCX36307.1 putative uncharacterized protein [Clostridium sp. CAG:1000]